MSVGITAYFGLGVTLMDALLVTGFFALTCAVVIEGMFRRRTEKYLAQRVSEIAQQLGVVARTNEIMSDQVNYLSNINVNNRLEDVESDISVLGTVVRELAEAVAEVEETQATQAMAVHQAEEPRPRDTSNVAPLKRETGSTTIEDQSTDVPISILQDALAEGRLRQYLQPIVTLPHRRTLGYDLVPKVAQSGGKLLNASEFLPQSDRTGTIAELEQMLVRQGANIIHRSNSAGEPTSLFVPISYCLLNDTDACEQLIELVRSNRAVTASLFLMMDEERYAALNQDQRAMLSQFVKIGVGICLNKVRSLRLNFQELYARGVRYVKADTQRFIDKPQSYSDLHNADVADFVQRYDVGLIMDNVVQEEQILMLLDDKIPFAQGEHIAPPSPVRPDLLGEKQRVQSSAY
ncbi:EAL domain-containing protein [Maritalea mediterranea]|uniref:EAL domain-containing protein n=1 Tax=Maritalea mediterranea TaxID=2909667 RepID=A0ABS9E4G4_9HYPH|nr:EAL domain-containing protein [Maritalea mediterranea]MCF4097765.1 EAL domain-containing protein [Maritalea mediterranea]